MSDGLEGGIPMGRALEDAIRGLLPAGVALAAFDLEQDRVPDLYPEEARAVARAVERRRLEFARGRGCARRALAALGMSGVAIPVGEGRAPVWPDGVVGSITHCEGLVAAVVARSDRVRALGLDAEPALPLDAEVRSRILHPSEPTGAVPPELERLAFSAKEAVHKAVYPMHRRWLDPQDVVIAFRPDGGFHVAPSPAVARLPDDLGELRGRWALIGGVLVTLVYRPV